MAGTNEAVDRVTSVEEAIDILDARRPKVVTLRASPTDSGAWPDDEPEATPAVTIVLDHILLSVPSDGRRSAWAAAVQRVVGNLAELVALRIEGINLSVDMLKGIAKRSPDLQTLALTDCTVDDAGARVIAERLPNLTSLGFAGNRIGERGARSIGVFLPNLMALHLGGNQIGETGALLIARRLHDLTSLDLDGSAIGDEGARALTLGLPNLTRLSLAGNQIGEVGVRAIAERLYRLTHLDLARTGSVAAVLGSSPSTSSSSNRSIFGITGYSTTGCRRSRSASPTSPRSSSDTTAWATREPGRSASTYPIS